MIQIWGYSDNFCVANTDNFHTGLWSASISEAISSFIDCNHPYTTHSAFTSNDDYTLLLELDSTDTLSIDNYPEFFI